MKKEITIAIPVFNGEKYITDALESIVDQTVKVDQILVCDNHSTDNTVEIVRHFQEKYPQWKITLQINEVNLGNIKNYNKCMNLCETDYLLILSSDDKLKTDTIEKELKFLEENPEIAFVAGDVDAFDEQGNIVSKSEKSESKVFNKGEVLEFIKETNMWIQHSALLMNTKYTKEIGDWEVKPIGGDERFYARVVQKHPIALIREPLVYQRVHVNQLGNREHLNFREKILHFKTNLKTANLETDYKRRKKTKKILKKWIGNQCIQVGRKVWKNHHEHILAFKYWIYGIRAYPRILFKPRLYRTLMASLLSR